MSKETLHRTWRPALANGDAVLLEGRIQPGPQNYNYDPAVGIEKDGDTPLWRTPNVAPRRGENEIGFAVLYEPPKCRHARRLEAGVVGDSLCHGTAFKCG